MNCQICLKKSDNPYHAACLKQFFAINGVDPVIPMTSTEFYERAPAHVTGFSISGAQVKMQIKVVDKQIVICASGGDYILKPSPQAFPQAAENEHLCMQMASAFKFDIPPVALLRFTDEIPVFAIKRFDRSYTAGEHKQTKIHQEDLMQAMGLAKATSHSKYEYSYQQVLLDLIKIAKGLHLSAEFFKRLVFAYLIGNDDLHLKNISLLYTTEGIRLTPLYDYLSTSLYDATGSVMALSMLPDNKETMAFNQMGNGYYSFADFLELGTSVGLSEKFITKSIRAMTGKIDKIETLVKHSYLNTIRQEQLIDLINNRKARLI
ncbi:MAG TPA: type II toxin-antitoxin system HipA family toxin [Aeromonadales bacterium]|nr:type II toxin-antitoxin system HipA family toxin [Aeromonadales bacterium]